MNINKIRELVPEAALYEQLAEEAAELAQAALKCARSLRGDNPTPITDKQAQARVVEEFSDVLNVASVLELEPNMALQAYKLQRWVDRLEEMRRRANGLAQKIAIK